MKLTVPKKNKQVSQSPHKLGPFTTQIQQNYSSSFLHLLTSRRMRKGLPGLLVNLRDHTLGYDLCELSSLFSCQPKILSWWVAILFMIGSACFAGGSVMNLYLVEYFSVFVINTIYFIGSIFFTTAAYGQYLGAINADITNKAHVNNQSTPWMWFAWRLKNLGFLSSASQLLGTVLFNLSTFDAFYSSVSTMNEDILVWMPDMLGSILFLLSSFFAWLEIYHDHYIKALYSVSWWSVWINIFGSLFFQLSAFVSFISLSTTKILNEVLNLEYTLYGAVCFFIGAYLMLIEMNESTRPDTPPTQ